MKIYVLTLSQVFPATHYKKGKPTDFRIKFTNALAVEQGAHVPDYVPPTALKLHTIRANYPLWQKRFEEIENGEACLSVRQWSGRPYASKQVEIRRLTADDGIGLQRLQIIPINGSLIDFMTSIDWVAKKNPAALELVHKIAENDGLSFADWKEWFFGNKKYNMNEPLAIIHFTKFRY